ncbi:hypothetical protein ACVI1N_005244 [Sinorhizobium medicae]
MRQAHGLMVNYLYKLDDIETNHEAFATRGEVVAAPAIRRLVPVDRSPRSLVPVPDILSPDARSSDAPGRKGNKEFTS